MSLDSFGSMQRSRYYSYRANSKFQEFYNWLSAPEQVDKMIEASKRGVPPLEGVVKDLVERFIDSPCPDLHKESDRQAVGAAIKDILFSYGYLPYQPATLSSKVAGEPFKRSTLYSYVEEYAENRLKKLIVVEATGQEAPYPLDFFTAEGLKELVRRAKDKLRKD